MKNKATTKLKRIIAQAIILFVFLWAINLPIGLIIKPALAAAGEGNVILRIDGISGKNKVTTGSFHELEFELSVGSSGIAADGTNNIQIIVPNAFGTPQITSSTSPGFVSVNSSNPSATLAVSVVGQSIFVSVSGVALSQGDLVWIKYGDTNMSANPGAAAQATSTVGSYDFIIKTDDIGGDTLLDVIDSPITVDVDSPIKISELEVNGNGVSTNEFVELYNNSEFAIDLAGWSIAYSSSSATGTLSWIPVVGIDINTHLVIPPFGFFLFASAGYAPNGVLPDVVYPTSSLNFDDNGGYVAVRNQDDVIVDYVGYGSLLDSTLAEGGAAAPAVATGTIERKAFGDSLAQDMAAGGIDEFMGNGWDTDNNALDFVQQSIANPQNSSSTPEQPNYFGTGPMIMHMPVNLAPTGSDLVIIAQMGDPQTSVDQLGAELHYMVGDGTPSDNTTLDYTTVLGIHHSNGYFQFIIPQVDVDASTVNGLYYYLKLTSNSGTAFMSASPEADMSGDESIVAQNPFIITCEDSTAWVKHNISGTITDSNASSVPDALIFIEGTGYRATSSLDGSYIIPNVKDGIYNIIVTKDGYFEEWFNDIYLNGSDLVGLDRTLFPGVGGGLTGDNTKPIVIWTGPPDGMVGIPAGDENFKIFVGFSKDLDPSTFNNTNVFLSTDGVNPIPSTVIYDNNPSARDPFYPPDPYLGIISPPAGGFATNTTYYLIMTSNVRDTVGNALEGNRFEGGHEISFTTGADFGDINDWSNFGVGAMMPPFVVGTIPANGAIDVVPNTKIIINFSDPMSSDSVTASNIKLYKISIVDNSEVKTSVNINVSLDTSQQIAIITPESNLTAGKYRIVVTGAPQSATGIWMGDPAQNQNVNTYEFFRSDFSVGENTLPDNTKPTVLGTWPTDGDTDIPINPGVINIQFSEGMDPSSINANTITLKRGTSLVSGAISYDPMAKSASFAPTVALVPGASYTLTISGDATATSSSVTDIVGNPLAEDYVVIFTTSSAGDTEAPEIMFARGDDYAMAITFSEPMNSAKITDNINWPSSVLNPGNYIIKWGDPATVAAGGTIIDLGAVGAMLTYDPFTNTVMIENLGLDPAQIGGKDYYIDLSNGNASDLSGNKVASSTANTFQMPIDFSADTMGILGPGTDGPMLFDMGQMGMMKAGAFPMNSMAGQTTTYFVDVPVTNSIDNGYKIVITFPAGFDVSGAKKDEYSPVNNNINEWNEGVITFSTSTELSGGANNDGVVVDANARTVTIELSVFGATPVNDFLHLDIAGIRNSSIPRDFDTSGYNIDMKILQADGTLSESINTMPFFITPGGNSSLVVNVLGIQALDVDGVNDEVKIFLGSPMTGPIESAAIIAADGSGSTTFSNLPTGQYMIFTEPNITLDGNDYYGLPMPEPINIDNGLNTKNITLTKEEAGAGKATITVNINGDLGDDDIDVFAGSPSAFKVKTITSAGLNPSTTLYLTDGTWMVGMGPAMPVGPMAGPPPMPDWMPPAPVEVTVSGNGTIVTESSATANDGIISLNVSIADMQIIGYVEDDNNNAIADAEVWAYQPMNAGAGSHTKTDTDGRFVLKVAQAGNYSVGVFKPGLPPISEKSVTVENDTDSGATDSNSTADVYLNNNLITSSNKLIFRVHKPGNTISGKLTDGSNPVSWAPVWADQLDGAGHTDTMTDSAGNYVLYVENGVWQLNAYIPEYGEAESQTVIIDNADVTQNLAPNSDHTYYTISGKVGIDTDGNYSTLETPFANMPIRAVAYNSQGVYLGQEYNSTTDSDGNYTITVPAGTYRVDIWTPEYGELGVNNLNGNNILDESADDAAPNSPANVIVSSTNVSGADIIVVASTLRTVTLHFANAQSSQSGILNIEGVDFSGAYPEPTGFRNSLRISDLSATTTIELADGDYLFFLSVPGLGDFIPDDSSNPNGRDATKDDIVVSGDRQVDFTLPDINSQTVTISGTVYSSSAQAGNELEQAWVWIENPANGYHNGIQTDTNGSYSLVVPITSGYKMGADKPGYLSAEPIDINASADISNQNFILTPSAFTISGHLYYDTNNNNVYDSGEEVPNGFVRAATQEGNIGSYAPADGSGYYELGVSDGAWLLYGVADGYEETQYSSAVVVSGSSQTINIKLTRDNNWTNKSKKKPITPAAGGSFDDTAPDGTGVKLNIPPNALGNSNSAGNLNANTTGAVIKTNSSDPVGNKGVKIVATDNSGQTITNLNDYIDIEMVLYKADVEEAITAGDLSYNKLKNTKNAYWDPAVGDWVKLATTRTAYYKNSGDTEWKLYVNSSATDDFSAFVDTLPGSYADYKLVYSSKVNHLTVFGVINPTDLDPPATPSGLSAVANNGSVSLSWNANTEDDFLEYQLFRGTSADFTCNDSTQINTSSLTSTSYTDNSISNDTSYTYYYKITAVDDSGNISDCSSAVQASYTYTPPSGSTPINILNSMNELLHNTGDTNEASTTESISEEENIEKTQESVKEPVIQKTEETINEITTKLDEYAQKIKEILAEAAEVLQANINSFLEKFGFERSLEEEKTVVGHYLPKLLSSDSSVDTKAKHSLINFITYGTPTTLRLGEGERAGVVNSFKAAFGRLPQTETDWNDVIKIANGRWPEQRSEQTETNAREAFYKIYLREPDMSNPHDNAAVTIIAYGLRPLDRNLESEKRAIQFFRAIYGYNPESATAWDIVRAIAYSGATR